LAVEARRGAPRLTAGFGINRDGKERHRLTLYDAACPELARRRCLPLATLDSELRAAAIAEDVALLGLQ